MNKKIILAILIMFVFIACKEEENGPVSAGTIPVIEKISTRLKWNVLSTSPYKIEVQVRDPQGPKDIADVIIEVFTTGTDQLVFSDSLFDDGSFYYAEDGDVWAGDGIFSNTFRPVYIDPSLLGGDFLFKFTAHDLAGNVSQSLEQMIILGFNSEPEILAFTLPDTLSSGAVAEFIYIGVRDADGLSDIEEVYVEGLNPAGGSFIFRIDCFNDGNVNVTGDLFPNDSVFSARLDSTFGAAKSGYYNLIIWIKDSYNATNIIQPATQIYIENKTGKILTTTVPDSMHRPTRGFNRQLLTVQVTDPQGLADVDSVYFYSLKPDSTFANNGQPISLVDNGLPYNENNPGIETGDVSAADGIYSFSLLVANSTLPGTYTFSFFMRDKAGNRTEVTERQITIY